MKKSMILKSKLKGSFDKKDITLVFVIDFQSRCEKESSKYRPRANYIKKFLVRLRKSGIKPIVLTQIEKPDLILKPIHSNVFLN